MKKILRNPSEDPFCISFLIELMKENEETLGNLSENPFPITFLIRLMKETQGYVFADSRGARAAFGRPRAALHFLF